MKDRTDIGNHDLDELFERYRQAPEGYVFVLLADACRKMGRIDEALEICEQGVARHPRYASGYVVKGKCVYDQGDQELARKTFGEVLALDANNLVALKYLGVIEADAGRFDKARECFQHILALDPDNDDIKRVLKDVDEREQVESATLEPVESGPAATASDEDVPPAESPPVLETSDELATITLADIFASQGYKDKALKIYSELLKKQPDNPLILAKIEALMGDREEDWGTGEGGSVGAEAVTEFSPEAGEVAGFLEFGIDEDVSDGEEAEGSEQFESFTDRSDQQDEAELRSPPPEPPAPVEPSAVEPDLTKPKMVASEAAEDAGPDPASHRQERKRSEARDTASQTTKREIDEKDNFKYFRSWLNRMQD